MARRPVPRILKARPRVTVAEFLGGEMRIKTHFDQDDVALRFKEIGGLLGDLQPVLQEYAEYLIDEHIPEQFRRQGFPRRWARLSSIYALWKLRRHGRLPILVLSGKMRRGFSYEVGKRVMRITNTQKYWVYHQYGTNRMPARPVMTMTKNDQKRLQLATAAYLAQFGSAQ
jgi:phage gpG-like protein